MVLNDLFRLFAGRPWRGARRCRFCLRLRRLCSFSGWRADQLGGQARLQFARVDPSQLGDAVDLPVDHVQPRRVGRRDGDQVDPALQRRLVVALLGLG